MDKTGTHTKRKKDPLCSWSEQWAVSSETEGTDTVGCYLVESWRGFWNWK